MTAYDASSELLDYLCGATHAQYLSDLYFSAQQTSPLLLQVIQSTPSGRFSIHAWQAAATYLTGQSLLCSTAEDEDTLRRQLIDALTQKENPHTMDV